MKNTFIALIVFFFCLSVRGAERYYFSKLSLEDGLSQITVLCSFQDSEGYIWFGTRNGLNRFDGYNFNVFLNEPGNNTCISDNHILCITEDKDKNLWIGTNNGLNKLDPSTNTFKRYFHDPDKNTSLDHNIIYSLYVDDKNHLWIGTGSGLNRYDPGSDSFQSVNPGGLFTNNPINAIAGKDGILLLGTTYQGLISMESDSEKYSVSRNIPEDPASLSHNYIRAIHIDKKDNLWIGTHGAGLNFLRKGDTRFVRYDKSSGLTNNYIRCINESPEGDILTGTFNGMDVITPGSGKITHYNTYDVSRGDLSHYSVYSILFDRSGTLWIGTYAGGINFYNPFARSFHFYDPSAEEKTILGIIGSMLEYKSTLYIATEGGGLLEFDMEEETFNHYILTGDPNLSYGRNILKTLYLDGDRILCGTNIGTIYSFNPHTKKFVLEYQFEGEDPIYAIRRDSTGHLMVGGVSLVGLYRISRDGTMRSRFPVKGQGEVEFPNVRCLLEIEKNVFLIGTRADGLFRYDANNEILVQYKHLPGSVNPDELPENYISSIYRDRKNNIWIGTFGGGFSLFDVQKGKFTTYGVEHKLLNNNVCTIVESDDGHLWISTIAGISDFNPQDLGFKNYTHSNGININEFTPHSGIMTSMGKIYFSGNNGFVSFNPHNLSFNPYVPPIILNEIYLNNVQVIPGGEDGILKKRIGWEKEITLKHNQSNISIQYSALNFIFSNRNQYAYKLEGFDKVWNEVGTRRIAYYTNIPPGKYIFRVKGSNNDGIWNEEGTSIVINVLPPFWKTWWAYSIYAIIGLLIIALILRYFKEKERLENEVRLKQMEAKTQEEFHQARNKLFTNFSHELRTPLTLIISPLEDIVEQDDLDPKLKERMLLMRSNSRRLLRLVNNLMDFQKKESGKMHLQIAEGNIVKFVEEMCLLFNELAISRNIRFNFTHPDKIIRNWYDRNLMEKVCFNFLSNAFKNTPNGGSIDIRLDSMKLPELRKTFPLKSDSFKNPESEYLTIEIQDTGVGIPAEELEKIFIPFYQVAQSEHASSGTGLGLSLSQSIIEMHHGIVWAESPDGKGAIFRCVLPIGKDYYADDEIVEDFKNSEDMRHYVVDIPTEKLIENTHKKKIYTLLVVEDNPDVRHYIVSHLTQDYNVLEASNGLEALEKSIHYLPDLIITDLMMPKMDGIELCSKLKSDLRTGHIPVIMITARTTVMDIQEGFETGADDYITKPFNASILLSRVRNILKTREKLKDVYGKRFSLETLGVEVTSIDEKFMQKLYEVMEKNVNNPELNLDNFCKDVGMSRANLYRKIKAITGLSPNEFIRNFRLEMAAKMLKEAKMPVSEVYVAVGFNSHAYFSNCFKALYGISPTEYTHQEEKKH